MSMLLLNSTENMDSLVFTSVHHTMDYDWPIHFRNNAERHP